MGALLALFLLLPVMALAEQFAVVHGGRLNLREYADAASRSLGQYVTGSWVEVTGSSVKGWQPVKTMDGKNGYMAGQYLTLASGGSSAVVRYANGGYVNLRQGPSLDTPVIVRVTSGTSITLIDERYEWNYISVYQDGRTYSGYMHDSLIEKRSTTASVTTKYGGRVNVRRGPSSGYGSVGSLATGTKVRVLQKGSEWSQISGEGVTGFMSNTYLTGMGGTKPDSGTQSRTAYVKNPRDTQVLYLREEPSQQAKPIGQYRNGTKVKVVQQGPVWCEVYVGTRHGYMMTRYLSFNPHAPPAPDPAVRTAYVNNPRPTQVLYLREKPSQQAKPIGQYRNGTVVNVLRYGDDWCEVSVGQLHGYMMTRYLSFNGQYIPPTEPGQPQKPEAGAEIRLNAQNIVNVYYDASLTSVKAVHAGGKPATMLQYGDSVCMVLVDGEVGYVSTASISY